MITYIELWQAKQTWINLTQEERKTYVDALGPVIQQLLESGVQIISWGINDGSTFRRVDFDYYAVWSFPDENSAVKFEKLVESADWYTYFEQVNARGVSMSPQDVMAHMINL
jgi:hypothetical protein